MRIVLDACVPERLARYIAGHEVTTGRAALGTTNLDDGKLLDALVPLAPTLFITLSEMQPGELRVLGVQRRLVRIFPPAADPARHAHATGVVVGQVSALGTRFNWDPRKASANVKKHGVSFDEASTAFADPFSRAITRNESQ